MLAVLRLRLLPRLRQPAVLVLGGLLGLWLLLYFGFRTPDRGSAPGDGTYKAFRARGDGHYIYLNTLSLVFDRDLDLHDQYRRFGDPFDNDPNVTVTGKRWIYPVGVAVLQIPPFLVAHGLARVANLLGARIAPHGYTWFHQTVTYLATLLAGFAALVLCYRLARRHVSETAALWGTAVIGLGTSLHFYAVYWVGYAHAWTALAVALLVERWDATRGRHDARRYALLGALVGLAALSRMNEVPWAALVVADVAIEAVRRARRRDLAGLARLAGCGLLSLACAIAVASPELAANRIVFGTFTPIPQGPGYMRWDAPYLWEALFSPRHGLFVWTPIAYLGVLGLLAAPRRAAALAVAAGAGFLLQAWVNGSAFNWWFDWSFGARRFVDSTVVLALGLAFVVERLRAFHARHPRLAPQLALALALAPFVVFNLETTRAVARWKQQVNVNMATTHLWAASFKRLAEEVHRKVGNPFAWPANLVWAAAHHVEPRRFDELFEPGKLFFDNKDLSRPGFRHADTIKMSDAVERKYAAGPWERRKGAPADRAWARRGARLLIPLHIDERQHWIVRGQATAPGHPVTLVFNGDRRVTFTPAAGVRDLRVDFADGELHEGTNELAFDCPPPPAPETACFAFDSVQLVYEGPRPVARVPRGRPFAPW